MHFDHLLLEQMEHLELAAISKPTIHALGTNSTFRTTCASGTICPTSVNCAFVVTGAFCATAWRLLAFVVVQLRLDCSIPSTGGVSRFNL